MRRTLITLIAIASIAFAGCDKNATKKAPGKDEKPTSTQPTANQNQPTANQNQPKTAQPKADAPKPEKTPTPAPVVQVPSFTQPSLVGVWEVDKEAFKALMLEKGRKQGRLARVKKRLKMMSQFEMTIRLDADQSAKLLMKLGRRKQTMSGVWKRNGNQLVVSQKKARNPMKCTIDGAKLTCPIDRGMTFVFKKSQS